MEKKLITPTVWEGLKRKFRELTDEDMFPGEVSDEEALKQLEQRLNRPADELRDIIATLTLRPTGHPS